jgi:hypothetical protein
MSDLLSVKDWGSVAFGPITTPSFCLFPMRNF